MTSRTIGRQVTNGAAPALPAASTVPAWRAAMARVRTLYEVGEAPTALQGKIVWPSAGAGNFLMNQGSDGNAWNLHYGYGGSVYVPDLDAMVFGSTGEAIVSNQLTGLMLGENTPTWQFIQQPQYATTLAEAIAAGADWYYSDADYAALPPSKRIDQVGETNFAAAWDKKFPVGYRQWVARRKHQGSLTGSNRPHWFRYGIPCYVPASMTGTGHGAIIANSRGAIYGPFAQGHVPAGSNDLDWFQEVNPSGRRKHWLSAMDVVTRQWTRLAAPLPDFAGYGGYIEHPYNAVDLANKRVYYTCFNGGNWATYHADLSAGLAGVAISGPTNLIDLAGGPGTSLASNAVFCAPGAGALAGKRLLFMREHPAGALLMIEFGANTISRMAIAGLPGSGEWYSMGYDLANNRIYITTTQAGSVKSYRFTIPDDYTNAAAYTVTMRAVALNGLTLESPGSWQYGERGRYIDSLGVILITQRNGKALAYRPE